MTDNRVAVTVYLHPFVYRALASIARTKDTQVHMLIEAHVSRGLSGPAPQRRQRAKPAEVTDETREAIRHMNATGLSDNKIAKKLGLPQTRVSRLRREMGLPSPTPRVGGRLNPDSAGVSK